MKKGIIMQIDDSYLTLLTAEGEFLRARKQERQYAIGEEIHFSPINLKPARSFFVKMAMSKPVWAAAAALMFFLGTFIPMYQSNKAYAYMSIDLNPSIELGVNKKMQVVEITGFNPEGKKVVSNLKNWKKKGVSELTKDILVEIKEEGFLDLNNQIIISTVRTEKVDKDIEKKLEENIKEIKEAATNQELEVTVMSGTEKELKKAHELGVTTGKYQTENVPKGQLKKDPNTQKQENRSEFIPPGQLKKGTENNDAVSNGKPGNSGNGESGNQNADRHGNSQGETKIPPGQQKKNDETGTKQNYGQTKKYNEADSKQNQGQMKKYNEADSKQNHGQMKKPFNQISKPNNGNSKPNNGNKK